MANPHFYQDLKIFIRSERLADHNGHLSCIVTRMLDIFAAAGQHQYTKDVRLYCQPKKQLETLPAYKETLESVTAHGNHVVCYSSHYWSGTWCDICIKQTLMKAVKSEGGLSRGRMRNSDACHKCWVLTQLILQSLEYELTPFPFSLFNKDQKMSKANKAGFSMISLKELTDPLEATCSVLAIALRRPLWSLMAIADRQKITTTSGVSRSHVVISRFDKI
ncbi:hypothetical protein NHX12_034132 [Muraenolepis orangiensis]|uniref:Uncharacterized protein n=1 Tax=Muraenolepis orangiensis TaxID=630683 RepID=A0A9Q0E931_9TELE|nr:hypothetical protein NHX12_034132 [Muraenolepis orangiensis]